MPKIMLVALAATLLLAGGLRADCAVAMTLAPLAAYHAASGRAAPIERVTNICGSNGCVPVQTKRVQHPKPRPKISPVLVHS